MRHLSPPCLLLLRSICFLFLISTGGGGGVCLFIATVGRSRIKDVSVNLMELG